MKYWNKPFVLEIYIRVTKKNCIYTIKIGYGLTLFQKNYVKSPFGVFTLPNIFSNLWFKNRTVSIPFGVSALLNSISAIPVFMRAKLVICGEESFFRNISTENPLKTPLSPVFMRCAVKFNFSFIAFIYYNGNFL